MRGKRVTSWPTLETDIRNAGGDWVDEEVVVDGNLVTSRKPDDIPAFNREMLRIFSGRARPGLSKCATGPRTRPRCLEVADGTRTRGHRDHNPELYQLSYRHRARTE